MRHTLHCCPRGQGDSGRRNALMVEQSQEYGRGGATGHVLSEGVTGCLSYWVV
jgi:hypothetical protein